MIGNSINGPAYSSYHLNGHLICAIDIETTGLEYDKHDILEICILPLGPDLKPSKIHRMFHMKLQPKHIDKADVAAMTVNKTKLVDALTYGCDPYSAVDRLRDWFELLKLPQRKLIVPLGCNYGGIDKAFITEWLGGPKCYEEFFRSDFRDITQVAHFLNDQAELLSEPIPFPKFNLSYIASQLKVEQITAHDAVSDCVTTAECYRKMLNFKHNHDMYRPAGTDLTIYYRGDETVVRHENQEYRLNREKSGLVLRVGSGQQVRAEELPND